MTSNSEPLRLANPAPPLCCPDAGPPARTGRGTIAARPVLGRAVRAGAGHALPPDLARIPAGRILPALERALRRLSRCATACRRVGACGVGRRGQCRRAAGQRAAARTARPAPAGHHDHADRVGARDRAMGAARRARLPALRPVGCGEAFPGALPTAPVADRRDRTVAEPAVLLPRSRHPRLCRQRAPVGALAARLPRVERAGRARAAHGAQDRGAVA